MYENIVYIYLMQVDSSGGMSSKIAVKPKK